MSLSGQFEVEENDIVKLLPDGRGKERAGYVNVGANSVYIHRQQNGDLLVEVHPRGNEGGSPLAAVTVTRSATKKAGGVDFD